MMTDSSIIIEDSLKEYRLIKEEIQRSVERIQKICIVSISFPPFPPSIPHNRSSIELGIINLARYLKNTYDVFLISKHFRKNDGDFDDTLWEEIPIYRIGEYYPYMFESNKTTNGIRYFFNELFNLRTFYRISTICRKEKPSVMIIGDTRQMSLAPMLAAKFLDIPYFIRYDSLCPLYPKEHACTIIERIQHCGDCVENILLVSMDDFAKKAMGFVSSLVYLLKVPLYNSSTRIFTLNTLFTQLLKNWGIDEEKLRIIPTSHSLPRPLKLTHYKDLMKTIRQERGKIILYVGRLSPEKGINILLESYERLVGKYEGIFLLIAGEGVLKDTVRRKEAMYKNIHYLGWQNEEQLSRSTTSM
jgi:glycosyltransferase involved in cell wall biosynthesis